ncbi:site-specific DNA-methyltransferase (adenine-specific) [Thermoanaerobacter uzonensis DSM 18761]|uniref:Methyltransferase n=1 Tax=Thermoanaerobacter uzonensis DSM 18761 TaxID=1123369 RepID=A0A1M4ZWY1_9THEO|nr:site-specific DNA-methyltransferase [Thermoanaerobacter uzonensis]SHF22252.1 site-specific DNA-methyltransferase (adenine-specific) [Thermoanaerobacter uzonensis DSM 18761]
MEKTSTYSFGVSKRESHDSSAFYSREIYKNTENPLQVLNYVIETLRSEKNINNSYNFQQSTGDWMNKIYCQSSENMFQIPDGSIALAFTSPPYNSGKEYDKNLNLIEYLILLARVGKEVFRTLKKGGRYVINIANLGRKPYIPLHSFLYIMHMEIGFKPAGEIIWQKGKAASNNCAWGSWLSAKSPRIRDIHEYLLVFVKEDFSRVDKGVSTINKEEFLSYTLSIWEVPPESAKKVGHPAPFPVELASRVIKLFSYENDVILDPFVGSGTTCVAAKKLKRNFVGYDINEEYCKIALKRLQEE